ncbi:MAG: hypothetical protein HQM10_09740 [Candidatus Riflebacteria bacterium]|nr:hypothetical protein [Candidatus Riflebacteria bacterium]
MLAEKTLFITLCFLFRVSMVFSCNGVFEGKYCSELASFMLSGMSGVVASFAAIPFDRIEEPVVEPQINTSTLEALVDSKVPIVLLAASLEKTAARIIPGSCRIQNNDVSEAEIEKLLPDKNRMILVYDCDLELKNRYEIIKKLKKMGYSNLIDYQEGLDGWLKKGREVEVCK